MLIRTLILLFCALGTYTPIAHGYFTTAQHAYSPTGEVALFVIDFTFGHAKYDMALPMEAVKTFNTKSTTTLQFEILTSENTRASGTALAYILSDADQENGMYVVKKGTKENFRLVALYTRTKDEAGDLFRAQVTQLPVSLVGFEDLKLNPKELIHYTTNFIPLAPGFTSSASSKN
jgi:hypothetical protein